MEIPLNNLKIPGSTKKSLPLLKNKPMSHSTTEQVFHSAKRKPKFFTVPTPKTSNSKRNAFTDSPFRNSKTFSMKKPTLKTPPQISTLKIKPLSSTRPSLSQSPLPIPLNIKASLKIPSPSFKTSFSPIKSLCNSWSSSFRAKHLLKAYQTECQSNRKEKKGCRSTARRWNWKNSSRKDKQKLPPGKRLKAS